MSNRHNNKKKAGSQKKLTAMEKMDVDLLREAVDKSKDDRKEQWIRIYNTLRPMIFEAAKDGARRISIMTPNPVGRCANAPAVAVAAPIELDEYKNCSTDYWCDFVAFARTWTGMDVNIWQPKDQVQEPKQLAVMFQWGDECQGIHTCEHGKHTYDSDMDE